MIVNNALLASRLQALEDERKLRLITRYILMASFPLPWHYSRWKPRYHQYLFVLLYPA